VSVDTKYRQIPGITNAYELGVYHLGSPGTAIVPLKCPIDRAEYGRRLAEAEGGRFTSLGYVVPSQGHECIATKKY
jgi:hypothetical protein